MKRRCDLAFVSQCPMGGQGVSTSWSALQLMLRHAVNYFNMKKSKAVTVGGIIDNEDNFIADFDTITLDESRAVLCVHIKISPAACTR